LFVAAYADFVMVVDELARLNGCSECRVRSVHRRRRLCVAEISIIDSFINTLFSLRRYDGHYLAFQGKFQEKEGQSDGSGCSWR